MGDKKDNYSLGLLFLFAASIIDPKMIMSIIIGLLLILLSSAITNYDKEENEIQENISLSQIPNEVKEKISLLFLLCSLFTLMITFLYSLL